jgi:dihydrofolate synthase/folylpolyglutamate synthase
MFTRVGASAYKKDLTNTLLLCQALQQPQLKFKSIHIAGTNGKGSTSHMLAAVLQSAGYKTGLYTSPHLKDFRERIRINGEMISKEEVIAFVNQYKHIFEPIEPSFFEWTVALCFHHFAKHQVDIAIIETGLGGRLDSTNVIHPELSVITNIGWDHMDMLGDTLDKIAFEKSGIIKNNTPVVIGEYHAETASVFKAQAKLKQAEIIFAEDVFAVTKFNSGKNGKATASVFENGSLTFENIKCDLGGIYQQKNIATVFAAVSNMRKIGYQIDDVAIAKGIENTTEITGLMGRWQVINKEPFTVCDTAHNKDGIEYIVKQISQQTFDKLHMVVGMVKDKDITKILQLLPKNAHYYFCQANIPRALDANILAEQANQLGLIGYNCGSVQNAYLEAQKNASPHDMIYIGGSTFVVAEVI